MTKTSPNEIYDVAILGGRCILPMKNAASGFALGGLELQEVSIGIRDGKIAAITSDSIAGKETVDARGLHVLPGIIDTQVHFREPGNTHKEDLMTGTHAAALGGVTTVFEMPNTKPPTTTPELFRDKLLRAQGRTFADHGFFIGATPDNVGELAELEILPGCCAVKIFMGSSTGSLLLADDEHLLRAFQSGKRRVAVHAEDEARLQERKSLIEGNPSVHMHPIWRDEQTALLATQRAVALARKTGRPLHVLHVTSGEEMEFLKTAQDVSTVETTPQHLLLSAPECYEKLGTFAQMNPPIREARHRKRIWQAILDGTVTVIGTDHAPHTREEKALPYPQSPSGMPGVQTLLPLMLNFVNEGSLSLLRLVELLARNPARLYHAVGKGEIRVGSDADFTLVDLQRTHTIQNSQMASRCGWTPFDGMKIKGMPVATILRGQTVMRDGALVGKPIGQPVRFEAR